MAIQLMTCEDTVWNEVDFVEVPAEESQEPKRVEPKRVMLRNSKTQEWLSAHDNEKHVYWSSPKTEPWTWEFFVIENNNRIGTAHGTYLWYDGETGTVWQSPATDDDHDDTEGFLYVSEVPSDENVSPFEVAHSSELVSSQVGDMTKEDTKAAFNAFCKEQRPGVKAEHPGTKLAEQNIILKDIWNTLDPHTQLLYLPV